MQQCGQSGAVDILPRLIEHDNNCAFGENVGNGDRFFGAPPLRIPRATFADFNDFDLAKARRASYCFGALAIGGGEFAFRALLETPYRLLRMFLWWFSITTIRHQLVIAIN